MKAILPDSIERAARRDCAPYHLTDFGNPSSPPGTRHPSRYSVLAACVALMLLAAGCLSRPALVRQNFALQNPPATNSVAATNSHVLSLRSVDVSPLFAGRALVYRTGPNSYELDSYAGFLVAPDRALAIPIRSHLRNSGLFADVIEPGNPVHADEFLEVHVSEFYGDFRKSEPPAAVLSLRVIFFESKNFATAQVILNKEYSRRLPLKSNTAADLVAAYDQALAEIMAEVATDLAAANKSN